MSGPKLKLTPIRQGLLAGKANQIDVLVSVEAPDAPENAPAKRLPLNLALVIDRSGSMAGRPIREAIRAAIYVVSQLSQADRIAVIEYADEARVVVPSQFVVDRQSVIERIEAIQQGGCTNLQGGWLAGAGEVAPNVQPNTISRVILLSDGMANVGVTDPLEVYRQVEQLAAAGVTTSTYGLGTEFDEALMTGTARAGRGNAYYGSTAQDLMDPIQEELQLLSALYARQVRIRYRGLRGTRVKVINAFRRPAPDLVELPDLAYDSEAWAILAITVPEMRTAEASEDLLELLEVTAEFVQTDGAPIRLPPERASLPVLLPEDYRMLEDDPRVAARVAELEVARIEREAREAALRDDWEQVDRLMAVAADAGTDSAWASRSIKALRDIARQRDSQRMSKESYYSSIRKEQRLSPKAGMRPADVERAKFLREKTLQGRAED